MKFLVPVLFTLSLVGCGAKNSAPASSATLLADTSNHAGVLAEISTQSEPRAVSANFATKRQAVYSAASLLHLIGFDAGGGAWGTPAQPGYLLYGPYSNEVISPRTCARYRLSVDNTTNDNEVVLVLDINAIDTAHGNAMKVIAQADVTRQTFRAANVPQDLDLCFANPGVDYLLEYRVRTTGKAITYAYQVAVFAKDAEPAPIANQAWFPASTLFHLVGSADGAPPAFGLGWQSFFQTAGFLTYGPYVGPEALPAGANTALFILKLDNVDAIYNSQVLTIDIVINGTTVIAQRDMHRTEFPKANLFHPIKLDFPTVRPGTPIEFRVRSTGTSYVAEWGVLVLNQSQFALQDTH